MKFLKIIIILLALNFNCDNVNAQVKISIKIDSLKGIIKATNDDIHKIKISLKLAELLADDYPDSALIYYNKSLHFIETGIIKKSTEQKILEAHTLLGKGLVIYTKGQVANALELYDKAFSIFQEARKNKPISFDCERGLAIYYTYTGMLHQSKGNSDKALESLYQSVKILDSLMKKAPKDYDLIKIFSKTYLNIGNVHLNLGNYDKAISNYSIAKKICEDFDFEIGLGDACIGFGNVYLYKGVYNKAIEYYIQSLKIYEKAGIKKKISASLNNIGNTHISQGNFERALEYFRKALPVYEEINNKNGMATCYVNIAMAYMNFDRTEKDKNKILDNYSKAFDFIKKSLSIKKQLEEIKGIAFSYRKIGEIYFRQAKIISDPVLKAAKYDSSMILFKKSLEIFEQLQNKKDIVSVNNNLAILYLKLAEKGNSDFNCKNALLHANRAYKDAVAIEDLSGQFNASLYLQNAYKNLGNFKEALKYAEIYSLTRGKLYNEEKAKSISELEFKYEDEKKELQIVQMQQKQLVDKKTIEVEQEKNRKQKIIIFSSIAGLILVIVFALVLYKMFRQKRIANILLERQNEEIKQQKEEIQCQNEELIQKADEINAQRNHLELINKELEKLSIVARETDNSVVITDSKGAIEWVNEGFSKLFGYDKNEFIALFGNNLISSVFSPDIGNAAQICLIEKKSVVFTSMVKTKFNTTIWTQSTLTPVLADDGTITRLVAIDSDITKIKQAEAIIVKKNRQITDSINYAKLIQQALFPSDEIIKKYFPDSFILFLPKDIVSGDFYWLAEVNDLILIAVADCTGHGVPGAFMSMIGNTLLNEIVKGKKITSPSKILFELNEGVRSALMQSGSKDNELDDGMDISLCCINKSDNTIRLSLAGQNAFIFNEKGLLKIAGDICFIGGTSFGLNSEGFTEHCVKIDNNTCVYLFTDGYVDQFGGENDTKFLARRFENLLYSIQQLNYEEQRSRVKSQFLEWKGNQKQTDDITVLGFKA